MATATYEEIQQKIAGLQRQAEELKAKEMIGVIERIRNAIGQYDLTVEHIFGVKAGAAAQGSKRRVAGRTGGAKRAAVASTTGSAPRAVKYRDEAGKTWSGRGRRPDWLRLAIEDGAHLEDFAVKD